MIELFGVRRLFRHEITRSVQSVYSVARQQSSVA